MTLKFFNNDIIYVYFISPGNELLLLCFFQMASKKNNDNNKNSHACLKLIGHIVAKMYDGSNEICG